MGIRNMGGLTALEREGPPWMEITPVVAYSVGFRKPSGLLASENVNTHHPPPGHSTRKS